MCASPVVCACVRVCVTHVLVCACGRTPLYYPAKLALLLAMINPSTEVKEKLYAKVVLPFVRRHRAKIDEAIELGTKKARQVWDLAWQRAMRLLRAFLAAVWFSQPQQPNPNDGEAAGSPSTAIVAAAGAGHGAGAGQAPAASRKRSPATVDAADEPAAVR